MSPGCTATRQDGNLSLRITTGFFGQVVPFDILIRFLSCVKRSVGEVRVRVDG